MGEPQDPQAERRNSLAPVLEKPLNAAEKRYLLYVERGDCASVRRILEEFKDCPREDFDKNCVDPLNRSSLIAAIENENIELIHILLDEGIHVKDALLHAIKEEYVEAVELLLEFEETNHKSGTPYSWEAVDRAQCTFTPDITPLVLAAHMNNYEIIKILLDRGATLPTPHDVRCGCDDCVASSEYDSLRHSQARINAYRALSSPSLIALSSRDPLLTAFELSWELRRLSRMENEFREEYNEMREQVQTFATALLDHARTSTELDTILNYDPSGEATGDRTLERLKLAIKYKQKKFVAHPNVQQLLASIWYDGLPGFRRKGMVAQLFDVAKLGAMFPVYSMIYMMAPNSKTSKFMTKPFVKFICYSTSYAIFLMLLGAASQRVEFLLMEWFGNEWMQEVLADWKRRERGSLPGIVECGVIIYIISLITWELRSLWRDGLVEYLSDLWNIVDYVCNMFYTMWIALRFTSIFITWREYWNGWDPYYPREQWDPFDPMLLSEGMFAAGMILSFLKLVHIFSVNRHLGPLQISLGRMTIDIIKFFFIYTLVLFAFGCGMNQLLWYYADLEKRKCYSKDPLIADFDNNEFSCTIWRRFSNMFETSQSLFWASFGLVDIVAFELAGIKSFTRFWALLMFGSYSVINVIVLLNMLIAMMSNSYQIISERSDVEWKFARSQLWIGYFEEGDAVPPPFNLVPGVGLLMEVLGKGPKKSGSIRMRSQELAVERHVTVARLLVRRFVTAEQRKRDDFGITEDDVMEIRQDISTLRFELVEILRNNGMKTPNLDKSENAVHGKKGKTAERRLMKDFQIGYVEGIVNEAITSDKGAKDVFARIARAIGRRRSANKSQKGKDWNSLAQRRASKRDPIGSNSEVERRRMSRQSLRRYIIEKEKADMCDIDANKLVQYNPKLRDMSPATRVAYVKFKTRKIRKEYTQHERVPEEEEEDDVFDGDELKPASNLVNKFTAAIKESVTSVSSNGDLVLKVEPPSITTTNTGANAKQVTASQSDTPSSAVGKETSTRPSKKLAPQPVVKNQAAPTNKVPSDCTAPKPAATSKVAPKPPDCTAPCPPSSSGKQKQRESIKKPGVVPNVSEQEAKAETSNKQQSDVKPPPKEREKIQYSFDLEPGKGKSKVTGRMVQGWI